MRKDDAIARALGAHRSRFDEAEMQQQPVPKVTGAWSRCWLAYKAMRGQLSGREDAPPPPEPDAWREQAQEAWVLPPPPPPEELPTPGGGDGRLARHWGNLVARVSAAGQRLLAFVAAIVPMVGHLVAVSEGDEREKVVAQMPVYLGVGSLAVSGVVGWVLTNEALIALLELATWMPGVLPRPTVADLDIAIAAANLAWLLAPLSRGGPPQAPTDAAWARIGAMLGGVQFVAAGRGMAYTAPTPEDVEAGRELAEAAGLSAAALEAPASVEPEVMLPLAAKVLTNSTRLHLFARMEVSLGLSAGAVGEALVSLRDGIGGGALDKRAVAAELCAAMDAAAAQARERGATEPDAAAAAAATACASKIVNLAAGLPKPLAPLRGPYDRASKSMPGRRDPLPTDDPVGASRRIVLAALAAYGAKLRGADPAVVDALGQLARARGGDAPTDAARELLESAAALDAAAGKAAEEAWMAEERACVEDNTLTRALDGRAFGVAARGGGQGAGSSGGGGNDVFLDVEIVGAEIPQSYGQERVQVFAFGAGDAVDAHLSAAAVRAAVPDGGGGPHRVPRLLSLLPVLFAALDHAAAAVGANRRYCPASRAGAEVWSWLGKAVQAQPPKVAAPGVTKVLLEKLLDPTGYCIGLTEALRALQALGLLGSSNFRLVGKSAYEAGASYTIITAFLGSDAAECVLRQHGFDDVAEAVAEGKGRRVPLESVPFALRRRSPPHRRLGPPYRRRSAPRIVAILVGLVIITAVNATHGIGGGGGGGGGGGSGGPGPGGGGGGGSGGPGPGGGGGGGGGGSGGPGPGGGDGTGTESPEDTAVGEEGGAGGGGDGDGDSGQGRAQGPVDGGGSSARAESHRVAEQSLPECHVRVVSVYHGHESMWSGVGRLVGTGREGTRQEAARAALRGFCPPEGGMVEAAAAFAAPEVERQIGFKLVTTEQIFGTAHAGRASRGVGPYDQLARLAIEPAQRTLLGRVHASDRADALLARHGGADALEALLFDAAAVAVHGLMEGLRDAKCMFSFSTQDAVAEEAVRARVALRGRQQQRG